MGLGWGKAKRKLKKIGRKIEKIHKRAGREVEKGVKVAFDPVGGAKSAMDDMVPDVNIPGPPEEKVMPLPDDISLTARRKQRARTRGGRSSSILSDSETLG